MSEIAQAAPACPYCESHDLQPRGWRRPHVEGRTRTAIGINCNEDATRQRVQCRNCRKYFALPPLVRIEAKNGRPKVSRTVCACGSTDLRRAGWHEDGRQHVRCNVCEKEFALPLGIVAATPEKLDSIGRRIHFSAVAERDWRPDPVDEAVALIKLFESGECDCEEIRALIRVSESERRCLEFLADAGMLGAHNVRRMLQFREQVLEIFDGLAKEFPAAKER